MTIDLNVEEYRQAVIEGIRQGVKEAFMEVLCRRKSPMSPLDLVQGRDDICRAIELGTQEAIGELHTNSD